jgi:predicted lipid-binding transport protein (Tim44 family)
MGVIGGAIGAEGGSLAGESLGRLFGGSRGASAGRNIGRVAGNVVGGAIPFFKDGGAVKKSGLAYLHKGEYVVPANAKKHITKAVKAVVKKNKMKK